MGKTRDKVENGTMGSLGLSYGAKDDSSLDSSGGVGRSPIDQLTKKTPFSSTRPSLIKSRSQQDTAQDEPEVGPNG